MARTQTRRRSASRTPARSTGRSTKTAKGPKVAFTRSAEERDLGGSRYIRLNDDEKFVGYALFDPDPALEDNPGYVEYREHWDNTAGRFIPCWGEKNGCVFCRAGMNPSTRGLGVFLVTELDGDVLKEPEIKLFKINWSSLQEWWDELDEEESIKGRKVRIKCTSRADGDYITKFFEKDKLSAKDLKAALKDIPDLEAEIQKNLDRGLEALRVADILESDDDDEEDDDEEDEEETTTKKTRATTSRKKKVEEEEEDDEEEDDEEDEEDEEDDEDDETDDEDEEDDDEEDEDEDDDEDDEEDEDAEEDEDSTLEGTFTVVSTNEAESTFTLKEIDTDLYFSPDVIDDVDFDAYKKGDKITITAEKDDDNDWVATKVAKAKATRTRTTRTKRK